MKIVNLKALDEAANSVLASLAMVRAVPLTSENVARALRWTLELINSGEQVLPPCSFIADVGFCLVGVERLPKSPEIDWPGSRRYVDTVLGKLMTDWTIERAADTIRQYAPGDRDRGIAYVIRQIHHRLDTTGFDFPPAVIRNLLAEPPSQVRDRLFNLVVNGLPAEEIAYAEEITTAVRRQSELLSAEDIAALDHRMAIVASAQTLAYRQIMQFLKKLDQHLPRHAVRPRVGRMDVPTKILDENVYPVGGYSSIGTKGSIESLLQSQLAYLEPGRGPDLFAVRYVRDELFYYTRDENQFFRRKRLFVFRLDASMELARTKDERSPYQRIVMALAAVIMLVQKLAEWLTAEALSIVIAFPPATALQDEFELLTIIFRELIERKTVTIECWDVNQFESELDRRSSRQETQVLTMGDDPGLVERDNLVSQAIDLSDPTPIRIDAYGQFESWTNDDCETAWTECVASVLADWV